MSGILVNICVEQAVRILFRLSKRRLDGVGGTPGWFQNSGEFGIQLRVFTPLIRAIIITARRYWSAVARYRMSAVPISAIV